MVEDVLSLDSHLDPLPGSNADVLDQNGVEHLNGRRAIAEGSRSGAGDIRRRLGEGSSVEVVVQPALDGAGGTRIADQVRALCAIPDQASGLGDGEGHSALAGERSAEVPSAEGQVDGAIPARTPPAFAAERQLPHARNGHAVRDVMRRERTLGVEVPDVLYAGRAAEPAHVARAV